MNENDEMLFGFWLFLYGIPAIAIYLRARMVLGKNSQAANMYFLASVFLAPIVAYMPSLLTRLGDGIGPMDLALLFVCQAIIFISQENKLPALKKEQEDKARQLAEKQRKKEEDKRKKEEILDKWKD